MNATVWSDGDQYIYDLVLQQQGSTLDYVRTVTMSRLTGPNRWQIDSQLADSQSNLVSRSTAILDAASHLPLSESGWTKDGQSGLTVTSSVVFDYIGGTAQATVQVGTFPATGITVPLGAGISLVSSDEWIFELMTAPLAAANSGKLARVDLQPGSSAANWGRLIPIAVQAAADQVTWQGNKIPSVKVQAHDERIRRSTSESPSIVGSSTQG